MSLFREQSIPQDPPGYQGGELPQPQTINSWGQQNRDVGRTQQSPPTKTQTFHDR